MFYLLSWQVWVAWLLCFEEVSVFDRSRLTAGLAAPSSGEAALMTAFTGERVVAREKGQTKLNYFGQDVSGA
jgi:hypothetical protein